eukprot:jgi/Botrbrau1/16530/Bobra.314_1s0003.1
MQELGCKSLHWILLITYGSVCVRQCSVKSELSIVLMVSPLCSFLSASRRDADWMYQKCIGHEVLVLLLAYAKHGAPIIA